MGHDARLPPPTDPPVCTSSWASCVAMAFALRWVTVSLYTPSWVTTADRWRGGNDLGAGGMTPQSRDPRARLRTSGMRYTPPATGIDLRRCMDIQVDGSGLTTQEQ